MVRRHEHCIWSPLIEGDMLLHRHGPVVFNEVYALAWCLGNLEYMGFDTLIVATTPRAKGYGLNGVDEEGELARRLGYPVYQQVDLEGTLSAADLEVATTGD